MNVLRLPIVTAVLLGLLVPAAGCSFKRPQYYERTKRFTEDKVTGTRSFLERCLERETLVRVKPWERDLLTREDMSWAPDPMQSLRRGHIYFSKESALGGGSAGGGGCGCN